MRKGKEFQGAQMGSEKSLKTSRWAQQRIPGPDESVKGTRARVRSGKKLREGPGGIKEGNAGVPEATT